MPQVESESHIEEIRVPTDLVGLGRHAEIHTRLFKEDAAGSLKLVQDLGINSGLVDRIEQCRREEVESFELELNEEEYRVLSISRRMGGVAIAH